MNIIGKAIIFAAAPILCLATLGCGADSDSEKRAEIEKLIQTTGSMKIVDNMSDQFVSGMTELLKKTHADIPQDALKIMPEEAHAVISENLPALKEIIIQTYSNHFTAEDLRELNKFYATPVGQKVIKEMPAVMQENYTAGRRWGESLGPEISRRVESRLKSEGISL